ncbi:lysozyme-like [Condylostylus longicornis]|uniref:lysozyme-like n=1 Tax=Condylostylus longicornis TaxID=2530218 RepID=UPI00244DDA45|nr:lysozyme-like [Condylostylus longicornis]
MRLILTSALLVKTVMIVVIAQGDLPPVSENCLKCICDTVTGCDPNFGCIDGYVCGPFRITKPYWIDGGNNTINGEAIDSPTAFENCVTDYNCAVQTVQGYMANWGQDCNGDGVINCYDHGAIHQLGRYGCNGQLPEKFLNTFSQCHGQA